MLEEQQPERAPYCATRCAEDSVNGHWRDVRRIAPAASAVKLNQTTFGGHHVAARNGAARRRGQCPKPRENHVAVGAQRRGIDGAEHSSKIDRVMAAISRIKSGTVRATLRRQSQDISRCDSTPQPGRERPLGPSSGSGKGVAHVPAASVRPETRRGRDRRASTETLRVLGTQVVARIEVGDPGAPWPQYVRCLIHINVTNG